MPVQWILSFSLYKLSQKLGSHHQLHTSSSSFLPLRSAAHTLVLMRSGERLLGEMGSFVPFSHIPCL